MFQVTAQTIIRISIREMREQRNWQGAKLIRIEESPFLYRYMGPDISTILWFYGLHLEITIDVRGMYDIYIRNIHITPLATARFGMCIIY